MSKNTCETCRWWNKYKSDTELGWCANKIVCRQFDERSEGAMIDITHELPSFRYNFGCIYHEPNHNKINKSTS